MPDIDKTARQKWPAPSPPPPPTVTAEQLELAREEIATDPLRAKARAVLALLITEYGDADWPFLDPVASLVEIILSHRTTDPQAWSAFQELRRRWPRWEDMRDAPVEELIAAVHGTTWPDQKGARVKRVLQEISTQRGAINIDFLKNIELGAAQEWLTSLEGVGPKSAACVLLFSCHRPTLPVDTHLHRVSQRLGLIGPKVNAEKAHPMLQALLPDPEDAHQVLNFHRGMLLHGQRICVWNDPKCAKCVIRDWCDYFAAHPEKQAEAAAASAKKAKRDT